MQTNGLSQGSVEANGLRFHYLEAGTGPLALCVHGFPDSAWTYRHLLPELAAAGYRAVAVFMRGYAPTQAPADVRVSTRTLAQDLHALHAALGGDERAVLISHDWGSIAAYGAAALGPDRWRRCVILNVPPFRVFGEIAFRYPQIKSSFYFWFFQMAVAETVVASDDFAFIDGLWSDWSPGFAAGEELRRAKDCLRDPAHLRAAMGYYKTLFDPATYGTPAFLEEQLSTWGGAITQRTLYLHGAQDGCLLVDPPTLRKIADYFGPDSECHLLPGLGHFMLVENPREVNRRIVDFLARP